MSRHGCLLAVLLLAATAPPALAQAPDLGAWDGVWFKANATQKGFAFHVAAPGVGKDKGTAKSYVQIHTVPGEPGMLTADVWLQEESWQKQTLTLLYLAGPAEQPVVYFNQVPVTPVPVTDPLLHLGIVLQLSGKVSDGAVAKGKLKTLGGYFIEIDDVPGSDERFAGQMTLTGKTTAKLPPDLPLD